MTPRDILAATSVAVVWGLVFVAIKVGVGETSPLMLSALRFVFASLPAVFFIAPPKAPAWKVALYGLLIGVGQFGALFIAMGEGFPVGLTSLVIQLQVYFTILIAWVVLGERPRRMQAIGAAIAFAGMAVIGSERLAGASLWPFLLEVLAALCWGAANVVAKTEGKIDALAFTVWSSLARALAAGRPFARLRRARAALRPSASDLAARRQRAGDRLCRNRVRLWPLGAAARPLFGSDGRAVRASGPGRGHGRRDAHFPRTLADG